MNRRIHIIQSIKIYVMKKILSLIVISFSICLFSYSQEKDSESTHKIAEFKVYGACGMCTDRIIDAVLIPGVLEADYNLDTHEFRAIYDPNRITEQIIHQAIAAVGHDTDKVRADDAVYNDLPGCCLYRDLIQIDYIMGKVLEDQGGKEPVPLIGTNVYWIGQDDGTSTDLDGVFYLPKKEAGSKLIFSYIGYQNDTIEVGEEEYVQIILTPDNLLDEVEVSARKKTTEISFVNPLKVEKISERELLKAACCNLSESFETTPSVDVSFTDAITGTSQIQMLGLAGKYTQITRENMPDVRGLSVNYGLSYIPGTWVNNINLSKGAGSVANGFESIAGQIDVQQKQPANMEKVYLNAYANEGGRYELNANILQDLGDQWGTGLFLHVNRMQERHDRNSDSFLDKPLTKQFIIQNRWQKYNSDGIGFQTNFKGSFIDNMGGEIGFNSENEGSSEIWGMEVQTRRFENWSKLGWVNKDKPYQSVGFQVSGVIHDHKSYFGLNDYDANQKSIYANLMYQSIIDNTNHQIRFGGSLQYDHYDESLNGTDFGRYELVPGAFGEYTFANLDRLSLVTGLRIDHHNHYGFFATPRLHFRYAMSDNSVLRISGGRGQRTANILSENTALLASSRQIEIMGSDMDTPYGLEAEVAWNYGVNFTHNFIWSSREGLVSLDLYRTDFQNQIVLDLEQSPQKAIFYNLLGNSYANSFQVQFDYELAPKFDVRFAYRWYDVKTDFSGQSLQKPLVSKHRAFVNLAYEFAEGWKSDFTLNWQGKKRIPFTGSNPEIYQLDDQSPNYVLMNAHLSKGWGAKYEIYVGVENLLNYKQDSPILASDAPFSSYFDSTLIWGPIFGRNTYFGVRYRLQ